MNDVSRVVTYHWPPVTYLKISGAWSPLCYLLYVHQHIVHCWPCDQHIIMILENLTSAACQIIVQFSVLHLSN